MDKITIEEARQNILNLKRLANNARLLHQWTLNENIDILEGIAEKQGMDRTVMQVTKEISNLLYKIAEQAEAQFNNTEISAEGMILLTEENDA